ncbi:hypothetical protein KAF25_008743 [Fusarium avenaceum]|uniref:Uncharacterized protein n=1 Tax=Fusarium avenaceum TaxID=40199 RepID=A0A9P7KX94_9HYPO|nr:hypothetical protein KAF25_008743 [Fusarium avenaceum]
MHSQAVEEPAQQAGPQATTEAINLEHIRASPQRHSTDIDSDIDDTALAPANGFLAGNFLLPTYRPKNEVIELFSPANWLIEWDKVLGQGNELIQGDWGEDNEIKTVCSKENHFRKLFVRIIFLSSFSFQFVFADVNCANSNEEITGTGKKSLLYLEKTFNDEILNQLKNGMQSKESIDYGQIVGKVGNLNSELRQVYSNVTTIYEEEERAAGLQ